MKVHINARAPFTVRQFRDASGVGRNVVIEVLEYFDSRGFTQRIGDTRRRWDLHVNMTFSILSLSHESHEDPR